MSRYPRLYAPGGYFHVVLRGVDQEDIFRDGADRAQFYFYLEEALERFDFRLNVFCLMTTHVHLVLRQGLETVGKVIHRLAFRYARRFNDRWGRRGHLFGDRFKGILVQEDNHLMELVRYVHLNPVRAGMVPRPEAYPWSSYRHYMGLETLPWVTSDPMLGYFGDGLGTARRRMHAFVLAGIGEEPAPELEKGCCEEYPILGDDAFVASAVAAAQVNSDEQRTFSLQAVLDAVSTDYGVTLSELASRRRSKILNEARSVLAFMVHRQRKVSLGELGRTLNRHYSTMSVTASRAAERARRDSTFSRRLTALGRKVTKELKS